MEMVRCPHAYSEDEDEVPVTGPRIRVMWDEGAGPLWDEAGLLPDDPEWLSQSLGLGDGLIADLLTWLRDMSAVWGVRSTELDERGHMLAERLQEEVGTLYKVRFQA